MKLRSSTKALLSGKTARFAPGKIVPALLTIVATPVFARVLGPSSYGVLAVASTATLLGAAVLFGWSEIVAVRESVDPDRDLESLISEGTVFVISAAVIGCVATAAFAALGGDYLLVAAVATAVVGWGLVTFYVGVMRGRNDAAGYVRTAALGSAGRAVLGIPAALAGLGPTGIVFGWAAGAYVAAALAFRRLRLNVRSMRVRLPSKEFVAFAFPAAAVTSCFLALSLCDRLLLSFFRSDAEVGTYALGYAIAEQSMVLGFSIMQASGFPSLLTIFENDGYEAGSKELARYMTIALTVVGSIALPLALFGPQLIELVGGAGFAKHATGFMPLVVVGVLLLGVGQYLSVPLQHARNSKSWARAVSIAAVTNIVLNLILIPPFGLIGAGIATALGYLAFLWLSRIEAARLGVQPLRGIAARTWLLGTCAGAAVGGACLAAGAWPVGVPASMLTYWLVAVFIKTDIDWRLT